MFSAYADTSIHWFSNCSTAHVPPTAPDLAPGTTPIENALRAHPVTLRLYGHSHEYRHFTANAIITGNAGAPLSPTGRP